MGIGGEFTRDYSRVDEQLEAISLGIELGMVILDTAEVYSAGLSEEIIGKAVKGKRDSVFISTKFSPENATYDEVLKAADRSLFRMKTDYIDLYQPHWPNQNVPIVETMSALKELQDQGKILHIGVSNFSLKEMISAQACLPGQTVFSNQVEYNLFDRYIENDILPFCKNNSSYVMAYSPLDKGRSAKIDKRIEVLSKIAEKYEKTSSQVALNWLMSQGPVIVIPKSTNPVHIRLNASAGSFQLEAEDIKVIDKVCSALPEMISPKRIRVSLEGEGNRPVYQTIEEALKNELELSPSPSQLADDILSEEPIKPVRVRRLANSGSGFDFELIEGRLRYWAWVIAFKWEKEIACYVRYD